MTPLRLLFTLAVCAWIIYFATGRQGDEGVAVGLQLAWAFTGLLGTRR